jgi:hypothetical protein
MPQTLIHAPRYPCPLTLSTAALDQADIPEASMNMHHLDLADSHLGEPVPHEPHQDVPSTREVLEELFQLLEEYAPTWYTEALHNRAVAALLGRPV